jgi:hypothetical protein
VSHDAMLLLLLLLLLLCSCPQVQELCGSHGY